MEIISFPTPGLGDTSYLLVHDGLGVLVDAQRDIDRFLAEAARRDVDLRFVLETHLHNDYVSGGEQAALRSGAELVIPAAAAPAYRHTPAFHLEDIKGDKGLSLRPIHTPGHTPEHTSYLVLIDGEPQAVFSGGSLLVAAAGRPDLLGPERAGTLARLQHGSLHRLADLPPEVALLPTHGAGSFCTTTGALRTTSTIGDERETNPLLAVPGVDEFAERLMAAPAPIPAFYQHMGPANTLGVPPMPPIAPPPLTPSDLDELPEDTVVVDLRPRIAASRGFLPGATLIELADDFGSWTGWLTPRDAPLVLVAELDQDVTEAVTQLAQIGVDTVAGVITDPGEAAAAASFELLELDDFLERLRDPNAQLLDVRMPSEREAVSVPGAVQQFLPDLFSSGIAPELDPAKPVHIACGSGRRALIAASLLHRNGFTPVVLTGAGIAQLAATLEGAQ
ncbi:MBL fold metallo-hydrolase [Glycomyces sp. L485]|uniref:rhodanese-like domain-containing protein n=1 Tax=Glycomyces sp. L485 TaxID=2909235 RepID=UPI001F4B7C21|nr:MBL fold metallo-hydrolase [Glycomyces sp. L485]MCH7229578.1 MBL fold metallo-hydrolase [Glycomyces sp. L485]